MDKKEKKIEKSRRKARTGQDRSKAWDDLNRKMVAKKAQEAALALEMENWIDEDENEGHDAEIGLDSAVMDGVQDLEVRDVPASGRVFMFEGATALEEADEVL
jgi:hypothetical protein